MRPDEVREAPTPTETLFPLVYDELKRLAHRQRSAFDARGTLCTTDLVHEAYLKLGRHGGDGWEGRAHFFGAAARAMRQVLVDFARRRRAAKRGGDWRVVSLADVGPALDIELEQLLDLDVALDALDQVSPRLRRVVELRFFAGLPEDEIAELLGLTTRTIERDWMKARLFLLRHLAPANG